MPSDSDNTPLDQLPRVRPPRPWRRLIETVAVIGSLFLGGVGTGSLWTARTAEAQLARQREDHLAEIARLRQAYGERLSTLTDQVHDAADTAASAAHTAGEAASTAQTAAQTANQAAKSAAKEMKKP